MLEIVSPTSPNKCEADFTQKSPGYSKLAYNTPRLRDDSTKRHHPSTGLQRHRRFHMHRKPVPNGLLPSITLFLGGCLSVHPFRNPAPIALVTIDVLPESSNFPRSCTVEAFLAAETKGPEGHFVS